MAMPSSLLWWHTAQTLAPDDNEWEYAGEQRRLNTCARSAAAAWSAPRVATPRESAPSTPDAPLKMPKLRRKLSATPTSCPCAHGGFDGLSIGFFQEAERHAHQLPLRAWGV